MIATITNHISKGVTNRDDTGIKMMWFKTNFNMPVKNYMTGSYVRYQGAWTYDTETLSYSLSGFVPGYEICNGAAIFDWENDGGSPYYIDTYLYVRWANPDLTDVYWIVNGYHYTHTLPVGQWVEVWWAGNVGCAGWEVHTNDTYHFRASATGTPVISPVDASVVITNCPSTTQLASGKEGYIWVEGNNLCYICADRWKHTMVGNIQSYVDTAKAGYIWGDANNDLLWIGSNGYKYTNKWKVKQFASFYSNGPTHEEYAGTSKKGFIWVDDEFGQTHLSYIGDDGYKYLTGAGDNPYNY